MAPTAGRVGLRASIAVLVGTAASLLAAAGAHASETVTDRFPSTGVEQTFVVPGGITTIAVRAIGGTGKGGGAPAEVTGNIGVSPGETLYVEVGGSATGQPGGWGGGGEGGNAAAGGGGGASDVRTVTRANPEATLASRLIVAGGSGGGSSTGNAGGAAGAEGLPNEEGGKPGTQTAGGESEELWECWIEKEHEGKHEGGTPGELGNGGDGEGCRSRSHGSDGGGGGGAGLYGGGGGGVEFDVEPPYEFASGGGGGSSLVPEDGTSALAEGAAPGVELTYTRRGAPPLVTTGQASGVGTRTAALNATVDPQGSAVSSCQFEYGTSPFYEDTVPCSASPGSGEQAVAVSAVIEGLAEATTYHYRIVATNAEGTSDGADAEFTTSSHDPPAVSGLSPTVGATAGGTTVTLTGTELEHVTGVTFGGAAATGIEHVSNTALRAVTPPGPPGQVPVSVEDDLGDKAAAGMFTFVSQPEVSKLGPPKKGPSTGGTEVQITGSALGYASEVLFGGTPATFRVDESGSVIYAVAPAHAAGKYDVRVISPGGASAPAGKGMFHYVGLEVTNVSPSSGPRAGGMSVTVTGVGFAPGSGASSFAFGKTAATGVECAATTHCTMTVPATSKGGTVDVRAHVAGANGKSKKAAADRYTYE